MEQQTNEFTQELYRRYLQEVIIYFCKRLFYRVHITTPSVKSYDFWFSSLEILLISKSQDSISAALSSPFPS